MTGKIDISPAELAIVQDILRKHLPKGARTWAFGSRVTWTAKPFSDLDLAVEAASPLPLEVMGDLNEAFENSDLPWRVDVIDLKSVSREFRAIVERQRVPADWQHSRVGDIFVLENGYAFKSSEFQTSGIPVIKIKNVKAGYFSEHSLDYVSRDFLRLRPTKVAKGNDLLISMSGNRHDGSSETWVGKVAFFQSKTPYLINQRVGALRLRPNVEANPRFFSFLLSSQPYQELFISIATSSGGQANLSPAQIYSAEIVVPPLDEQVEIEGILSALDDKIELNRQMNQTLEAMARAVFLDWFVDFGPTRRKAAGATAPAAILGGLIPDGTQSAPLAALFPDSFGTNGLPMGWEEKRLDDFDVELESGRRPKGGIDKSLGEGVPSLGAESIYAVGLFDNSKVKYVSEDFAKQAKNGWVQDFDVAIYKDGANVGDPDRVAMFGLGFPFERFMVNEHVFLVRSKLLGQPFLYQLMQSHRVADRLKKLGQSKAAQPGLNQGEVLSCDFIMPNAKVCEAYNLLVLPSLQLALANGKENQTLAATRDLLLPKLMSGELRLVGGESQE